MIAQGHGAGTGAIRAVKVHVVSPTEITAVTGGPAKPGTWNLFVVNKRGRASAATAADRFTYVR
ncbi:MAG: hypothetical protein ACYCU7_09260 [Acidimicrobiales bacterium]